MTVKREDLAAAAAEGVLQYTQVDPVLIFLLQRDAQLQRSPAPGKQQAAWNGGRHSLYAVAVILTIGLATALAAFHTRLASDILGVSGMVWFSTIYGLFAIATVAWCEQRRFSTTARIFCTSVIALVPLAVLALLHIHVI
jgi:hypothetical protein